MVRGGGGGEGGGGGGVGGGGGGGGARAGGKGTASKREERGDEPRRPCTRTPALGDALKLHYTCRTNDYKHTRSFEREPPRRAGRRALRRPVR